MAEVQKQEAISGANVQYEQAKNQMEIERMQIATQIDQQKLQTHFKYEMKLKQIDDQTIQKKKK